MGFPPPAPSSTGIQYNVPAQAGGFLDVRTTAIQGVLFDTEGPVAGPIFLETDDGELLLFTTASGGGANLVSHGGTIAIDTTQGAVDGLLNIISGTKKITLGTGEVAWSVNAGDPVAITAPGGDISLSATGAGGSIAIASGAVGFFDKAPIAKPTVTGSRGGNAALASLLTKLADLGLITDGTSA